MSIDTCQWKLSSHGLIIFPWPDINNGGHTLGLAPSKVEAGGGVGGDNRGQCVSPEAAKDSDQGGPDAKEKGEWRRVRRLRADTRGLVWEIINIPGDERVLSARWGKGEKLSALL